VASQRHDCSATSETDGQHQAVLTVDADAAGTAVITGLPAYATATRWRAVTADGRSGTLTAGKWVLPRTITGRWTWDDLGDDEAN
jgi:hypothetical protein